MFFDQLIMLLILFLSKIIILLMSVCEVGYCEEMLRIILMICLNLSRFVSIRTLLILYVNYNNINPPLAINN